MKTKILRAYRLNPELDSQILKMAIQQNKTSSDVVRDALKKYLQNLEK